MEEVTLTVQWEDPPEKDSWLQRLAPLMERPGAWAKIAEGPYDKVSRMGWALRHKYKIPPGEWEFEVSTVEKGVGQVHARYLGEGNTDDHD